MGPGTPWTHRAHDAARQAEVIEKLQFVAIQLDKVGRFDDTRRRIDETARAVVQALLHEFETADGDEAVDGAWAPRLRWRRADRPRFDHHAPSCGDFYAETERWRRQPLGRKLVVCKLTRTTKTSVVGAKLRITSPRVGGTVTVTELRTADAVRDAPEAPLGIVCAATEGPVLRGDCDEEAYEHL